VVKKLVLPVVPTFLAIAVVVWCVAFFGGGSAGQPELYTHYISLTALSIGALAFCCEFVDSTLGMGYGTALTPLLMIFFGFDKASQVVPAVLFSELFTGLVAALAHHNAGNVSLKPGSRHFKVSWVLGVCSVVGAATAVFIAAYLEKINPDIVKGGIGIIVLSMGVIILVSRRRVRAFSWKRIIGLGVLASFNKGVSGGGYGPLVTGGQLLSGVEGKSAVGITSLAEGLTCVVGLFVYVLVKKSALPWGLIGPLAVGALLSVPFSAHTVKKVTTKRLTLVIGVLTTVLGCLTLYKVIGKVLG